MGELKVTAGLPYKVVLIDGSTGVPVGGGGAVAGGNVGLSVDVVGKSGRCIVTPVLTVAATYISGDYVGTSGVPMRFIDAARFPGGTGYIQSVSLVDNIIASVIGELWMFNDTVTPPADSAAWTISDADMQKFVCVIPLNSVYYASGANSCTQYEGYPKFFKCAVGSKDLFGCFVTRGAPGYNGNNLTFIMGTLQD